MRITRRRISARTPGRPARRAAYVHLRATNSRCHRRMVSGVTIEATRAAGRSRRDAPFIIAQAQPSTVELHLEHAILFAQKLNHVALISIKPPEQRRKEQVKWNHARSLRQSRSTQFSDTTRRGSGSTARGAAVAVTPASCRWRTIPRTGPRWMASAADSVSTAEWRSTCWCLPRDRWYRWPSWVRPKRRL
jgi:hypothetical protein